MAGADRSLAIAGLKPDHLRGTVPFMTTDTPFHLAFPVHDLEKAEQFYGQLLGCVIGRRSLLWIDFDFFGHQITAHLRPEECQQPASNAVDGDAVPVRHFGAILPWDRWQALADRLQAEEISFLLAPKIRFKGKPGEQGTFFIRDPSGNALEFKTFKNKAQIFARGGDDDHI
ncbi:dioxygenase [Iodidimonas muriae]|uniref:Dioxygenase n=2 Tax=Iodidimonas muriae TaxID=261467 RepID=A0ABQ2LF02_9PROT|nr:dioxygenase [Kordiimonadales bacterium JCM 17843]GGO14054.1 dioxygenase [Iodidimonas muriae]